MTEDSSVYKKVELTAELSAEEPVGSIVGLAVASTVRPEIELVVSVNAAIDAAVDFVLGSVMAEGMSGSAVGEVVKDVVKSEMDASVSAVSNSVTSVVYAESGRGQRIMRELRSLDWSDERKTSVVAPEIRTAVGPGPVTSPEEFLPRDWRLRSTASMIGSVVHVEVYRTVMRLCKEGVKPNG